ncbi:MAG: hypothetical protein NTZ49_04520 [Candidatus Parcubacteria bacterium]|nr:hypothetical protein [Candidatus Parcubacteria bacterium]
MLKINIKQETRDLISIVAKDLFLALFALFLVFTIAEAIKPRIILSYVSLDLMLGLLLLFGLITVFLYQPKVREKNNLNFLDYSAIIFCAILLGLISTYFTRQIGYLALLVGVASAIISYYLISLCCRE